MVDVLIVMQCYVIIGLSMVIYQKVIDVGIDIFDIVILLMSMIYGYFVIEMMVFILEGIECDIGLLLLDLSEIVVYFCEVCKKYVKFEGSLKGVDVCILFVQVLGGMLINMENQFKEQGVEEKFDDVLLEILCVCEDLGFILLVIFIL